MTDRIPWFVLILDYRLLLEIGWVMERAGQEIVFGNPSPGNATQSHRNEGPLILIELHLLLY